MILSKPSVWQLIRIVSINQTVCRVWLYYNCTCPDRCMVLDILHPSIVMHKRTQDYEQYQVVKARNNRVLFQTKHCEL